jgi:uncharacterized membrane protein YdjX (TVP38/TMEM64 family)
MTDPNNESERPTVVTAEVLSGDTSPSRLSLTWAMRLGAAALVLLVIVAVFAGRYFDFEEAIWIQHIEDEIQSWGSLSVLASIGLMVVHSFVPFPAEFIAIANGMLFGAVSGILITWTGAMLGAFAAFGLARLLGRPFVERLVRKNEWQRIDGWTADQGWQVLLISRFIPVIAFNLINYAAGLTQVSWFTFAWTTGVGILPATILMVLVGHNAELMTWEAWLLLIACGIVLWLVVRRRLSSSTRSISAGDKQ